ncbi:MAG: S-layer homology domain-containing protein [Cellulosilyticaceae bacterium]
MCMKKRLLCVGIAAMMCFAPMTYGQSSVEYREEQAMVEATGKLVVKPGHEVVKMTVGDVLDQAFLSNQVMLEDGAKLPDDTVYEVVFLKGERLFEEGVAVKSGKANIRIQIKDSNMMTDACIRLIIEEDCTPEPPVVEPPVEPETVSHMPYIYGYEDGTFRPERSVTREELASMVSRLILNGSMPIHANHYSDLSDTRYSARHAAHLDDMGIMKGYGNGTFDPQKPITRGEMAAVIKRTVQALDVPAAARNMMNYADVAADNWAYESIRFVTENGFMDGQEVNGKMVFRPEEPLTRAEAVITLNRVFDRQCEDARIDNPYSDLKTSHWAYEQILFASVLHEHEVK